MDILQMRAEDTTDILKTNALMYFYIFFIDFLMKSFT